MVIFYDITIFVSNYDNWIFEESPALEGFIRQKEFFVKNKNEKKCFLDSDFDFL